MHASICKLYSDIAYKQGICFFDELSSTTLQKNGTRHQNNEQLLFHNFFLLSVLNETHHFRITVAMENPLK